MCDGRPRARGRQTHVKNCLTHPSFWVPNSGCSSNLLKSLAPQAHSMVYFVHPFEWAQQPPEFGTQMGRWGRWVRPDRFLYFWRLLLDAAVCGRPGKAVADEKLGAAMLRCVPRLSLQPRTSFGIVFTACACFVHRRSMQGSQD